MSLIKQALEKAEENTGTTPEPKTPETTDKARSGESSEGPESRRDQRFRNPTQSSEDRSSPLNLAVWSLVILGSSFLIGLELIYLLQVYL